MSSLHLLMYKLVPLLFYACLFSAKPGGDPPTDRSMPIEEYLSPALIYCMDVLVGLGLAIAFGILVFNTVTIRTKYVLGGGTEHNWSRDSFKNS